MKKTYIVSDMACSNCALRIESIEDELPGVKEVNASYHKQRMVVEFDETVVSDEQILAAVRKKGYTAISE